VKTTGLGRFIVASVNSAGCYRITVRGTMSDELASKFDGMCVEPRSAATVLTGDLADQAQLYGLLDLLRAVGLQLLRIEQVSG
jgi:hypothetical protein